MPVQAGETTWGKPWAKCSQCAMKKTIRELRRLVRVASVAKAAAPAKALAKTVPKHLRYLGPESAMAAWEFEVKRDAAHDADRLEKRIEEREFSADHAEFRGPITVCTRCHAGLTSPGRRRCDRCRSHHTQYMRIWRSAPWRREAENARESYRRAAHMEEYRARDREKTREARVIRERDQEVERLEAKLTEALEVMKLFRTIQDQEEMRP